MDENTSKFIYKLVVDIELGIFIWNGNISVVTVWWHKQQEIMIQ